MTTMTTGVVAKITRLPHSRLGNPAFDLELVDGRVLRTAPDVSWSYTVTEALLGAVVEFLFDDLGHVVDGNVVRVLTQSQRRILDEVTLAGKRTYSGRNARPIAVLGGLGLVDVSWDMVAQSKGNGVELVTRITVAAKEGE